MKLDIVPVASIQGSLRPPSDKSLTHRAYMLAAIANEPSVVRNPLRGEDCEATLRCLEAMGLRATWLSDVEVRLEPADSWHSPESDLDCGNSGTTMRLLSGLIAGWPIEAKLKGDASLSRRPMGRIAEPLRLMGATVEGEKPPIRIAGGGLRGISYTTPVPSAQIKSCVLLAGLRAEGVTVVTEAMPSRDHTERMLASLGAPISLSGNGPFSASIIGGYSLRGFDFTVPADISSTAFFMVAAALLPGSELVIEDLSVNPSRTGILDVLRQAGAPCAVENERSELGEPIGDVAVRFSPSLRPFTIEGSLVPRLIDEIPVLAVMATQCEGMSVIRDAKELRVKESDRIETVAAGLRAMGARVETFEDGMAIHGPCRLRGARIETAHDHRIAMAFAIAGLIAQGQTTIEGAEAISTSYPRFEQDLMGLSIV